MMLNSLIVGSTSQISNYFPKSYRRVSSRLPFEETANEKWDTVYICFGENRTYLADSLDNDVAKRFYFVNYDLTIRAVEAYAPVSRRVVVYSTAELWNDYCGVVYLNTPFRFRPNHYIMSKYDMTKRLMDKKTYPNVSIAYPFNFNGIHRSGEFLFGKVFRSILKKERITLGDTHYYRDILHPSMAAEESMERGVGEDFLVGSGRLTHVNDMIRSIYSFCNMAYEDFVTENITEASHYRNHIFYSSNPSGKSRKDVLSLVLDEIKGALNES